MHVFGQTKRKVCRKQWLVDHSASESREDMKKNRCFKAQEGKARVLKQKSTNRSEFFDKQEQRVESPQQTSRTAEKARNGKKLADASHSRPLNVLKFLDFGFLASKGPDGRTFSSLRFLQH